MSPRWFRLEYVLFAFLLAFLCGCSRSGEENPATASIAGLDGKAAREGGTALRKADSDPQHPAVRIETSLGSIVVKLDAVNAPLTVDNFLSYVNAGHYDQTIVHQVYRGQGFLAGGYGLNLLERPSRTPVRNEAHNGLKNRRGTIAMVRRPDAVDSATSQFFINVADNTALDHRDRTPEGYGYCVFGEGVEGLDVVDAIGGAATHDAPDFDRTPQQPIVIKTIRQIR